MRINVDLLLVVVEACSVVGHGHDKGIVVLVVIVKGIKENTQTIPLVIWSKHRPILASAFCEPKSLKIANTQEILKRL